VTAGAVSQQVKKLEGSLGVALFRRLPQGLLLTAEGEAYLPRITKVFEDLTEATEAIAPEMNGKKFTVGLCAKAKTVLPPNWPDHCDDLKPYVRDVIQTTDVEMLRSNEIDCLIRLGGGPYGELSLIAIPSPTRTGEPPEELHFLCKPGLADCRQSKAILENLWEHAGSKT
jgi:DNA-binding transcriptional LysR family regulator